MAVTISLTERSALTVLRSFLLSVVPGGDSIPATFECVRGQVNRVPEPKSDDFVVMTPLLRTRLDTNQTVYADDTPFSNIQTNSGSFLTDENGNALFVTPKPPGSRAIQEAAEYTVQLDFHGPASGDNVQIVEALFRSEDACFNFDQSGIAMQPLYSSDPRQMSFLNGEDQIEERWSIDVAIQINPIITTKQDFANAVTLTVIEVDATYPP